MKLEVASPCSESWEGMSGDDRVRFCGKCRLNVYNLSAMSQPEVDQIFAPSRHGSRFGGAGAREGRPPCVRFYARPDGTVLTRDCPVGRRRQWLVRGLWLAAALVLVSFLFIFLQETRADARSFSDWMQSLIDQLFPRPPVVMGEACPPPGPAPVR